MHRKFLNAIAASGVAMLLTTPALASTIYTFDVDYCSNGCLEGGTGGTVTLTQWGINATGMVKVDVTLSVGLGDPFHTSGGFDTFAFDLLGNPTISISNITAATGTWTLHSTHAGNLHEAGAGWFDYALDCSNCGPFAGGVVDYTLSFIVTAAGLTEAKFAELSHNNHGLVGSGGDPNAYFAASVFNLFTDATGSHPCTGVIGSDGGTTPSTGGSNDGAGLCATPISETPEPRTLGLIGIGLIGLGLIRRRRTK